MCKNLATLWQEFVRVFNNKFYIFFLKKKKRKEGREDEGACRRFEVALVGIGEEL